MPFKNYRDESRINWGRELCDKQNVTRDDLIFGTLQRIADATELMAYNHQQLITERDNYKKWYKEKCEVSDKLWKTIAGLRSYITRLKNKKSRKNK